MAETPRMLTREVIKKIRKLREKGLKRYCDVIIINQINQLKRAFPNDTIDLTFLITYLDANDIKAPDLVEGAKELYSKGVIKPEDEVDEELLIDFDEVNDFIDSNKSPSGVENVLNSRVASIRKNMGKPFTVTFDKVLAAGIFLVLAGFAYLIYSSGAGSSIVSSVGDTAQQVGDNIKL